MSEGSYMSIDLDTKKLKKYYSRKSPQGAYGVVKTYFESKGFSHLKDTNYENRNITTEKTVWKKLIKKSKVKLLSYKKQRSFAPLFCFIELWTKDNYITYLLQIIYLLVNILHFFSKSGNISVT